MLRALVWKEWREQRALIMVGTGFAMALPLLLLTAATVMLPRVSGQGLTDVTTLAFALMLWPMFAAAAGAGAFASEATGRTFGFLLSRPVSRARVWLAKVVLAVSIVLALVTISNLIARLLQWTVGAAAPDSSLRLVSMYLGTTETLVPGLPSLYLCFCAAAFLSTRVARPLAAAIGGLAITAVSIVLLILVGTRIGLVFTVQPAWIGAEAALLATLLLIMSFRCFATAEWPGAGSLRRTVATLAAVLAAVVACGLTPVLYAYALADLDSARAHEFTLSPNGAAAVVTAVHYPAVLGSLWRLPDEAASGSATRDGGREAEVQESEPLRLTRRPAFSPFFSPDGEWVYYFTIWPVLDLQGGSVDLRAVRIDGSEEHLVIEGVGRVAATSWDGRPSWTPAVVSASGSKAAFAGGWWGSEPRVLDLRQGTVDEIVDLLFDIDADQSGKSAVPIAWRDDELLLHVGARGHGYAGWIHGIVAHDADSGRTETVFHGSRSAEGRLYARLLLPGTPMSRYRPGPLFAVQSYFSEPSAGGFEVSVIDLTTGEMRRIEHFPCGFPAAAVSADGTVVAHRRFTSCVQRDNGGVVGAGPILVVRDLTAGTVEEFYGWGDEVSAATMAAIAVSPSGRRVLVSIERQRGRETYIVEADRSVRRLSTTRSVEDVLHNSYWAQWLDDNHVFLRYYTRSTTRLSSFRGAAIVNVNDGSVEHAYATPPAFEDGSY